MVILIDTPTDTDGPDVEQTDDVEHGECPTCGPDQEADADGHCSWCGRTLNLGPDPRSDPGWWRA